jgi:hypothetical protein
MKASFLKCGAFIKISIIFGDFFREIETFFLRITMLFKYNFSGIEPQSAPVHSPRYLGKISRWYFKSYNALHQNANAATLSDLIKPSNCSVWLSNCMISKKKSFSMV